MQTTQLFAYSAFSEDERKELRRSRRYRARSLRATRLQRPADQDRHTDPVTARKTRQPPAVRFRSVDAIAATKLPAVYSRTEYAEAGGLLSYAAPTRENFRRAAVYVDKILKGAKAGDLPIQQPSKFELTVNMKTAKAMGVKVPTSLLMRADKVIQ